jgi:alpha-ribazole phosphatase
MIFLRHPKPQAPAGLCYGRTDLDIGPEGEAEIARALRQTQRVTRVVASPALRCRKLAEELARRDGVALRFDPRLWELDFGDWEGMRWEDIPRADSDPWAEDPWAVAPPGGETFAAVHARVSEVLGEVMPGTALVCHAGPIWAARMILVGASYADVCTGTVPYATPIRIAREAV